MSSVSCNYFLSVYRLVDDVVGDDECQTGAQLLSGNLYGVKIGRKRGERGLRHFVSGSLKKTTINLLKTVAWDAGVRVFLRHSPVFPCRVGQTSHQKQRGKTCTNQTQYIKSHAKESISPIPNPYLRGVLSNAFLCMGVGVRAADNWDNGILDTVYVTVSL